MLFACKLAQSMALSTLRTITALTAKGEPNLGEVNIAYSLTTRDTFKRTETITSGGMLSYTVSQSTHEILTHTEKPLSLIWRQRQ